MTVCELQRLTTKLPLTKVGPIPGDTKDISLSLITSRRVVVTGTFTSREHLVPIPLGSGFLNGVPESEGRSCPMKGLGLVGHFVFWVFVLFF